SFLSVSGVSRWSLVKANDVETNDESLTTNDSFLSPFVIAEMLGAVLFEELSHELFGFVAGVLAGGGQVGAAFALLEAAAICFQQVGEPALAVGRRFGRARFVQLDEDIFD